MGSVLPTWRARCLDPAVRDDVTRYTTALGRQHQVRREQFSGMAVPQFSQLLSSQRSEGLPEIDAERLFSNQAIVGRILVSFDLFQRPADDDEPVVTGEFVDQHAARADAEARGLVVEQGAQGATYVVLDHAVLHGADFRIYDPRDLYPGSDRMSFIFVDDTGWPLLDGALVHVDDAAMCAAYSSPELQTADWHLSLPYVHLRYFLELWCDRYFAWMQRFLLPGLGYWRHEKNPDFDRHLEMMQPLEEELGPTAARQAVFEQLLADYDSELGRWLGELGQMAGGAH